MVGKTAEADELEATVEDAGATAKFALPTQLNDRLVKGGRQLWAGLGILATLGGAVGLFQVVSGGTQTEQARMLDMIAEGRLTADEAERLAIAFAPDAESASLSAGELREIASDATSKQRKALALIADPETRDEGIALWEASAETAEDWRDLSELVQGSRPEVALQAATKALDLDPKNFDNAVAVYKANSALDMNVEARRILARHADAAKTPIHRAMAQHALISEMAINGVDAAQSPDLIIAAETTLADLEPIVRSLPADRILTRRMIEDDPASLASELRCNVGILKIHDPARYAEGAEQTRQCAREWVGLKGNLTKPAWKEISRLAIQAYGYAAYGYYQANDFGQAITAYDEGARLAADIEAPTPQEKATRYTMQSWGGYLHHLEGNHAEGRFRLEALYDDMLSETEANPASGLLLTTLASIAGQRIDGLYIGEDPQRETLALEMLEDIGRLLQTAPETPAALRAYSTVLSAILRSAADSSDPAAIDITPRAVDRFITHVRSLQNGDVDGKKTSETWALRLLADHEIRVGSKASVEDSLSRIETAAAEITNPATRKSYIDYVTAERARLSR